MDCGGAQHSHPLRPWPTVVLLLVCAGLYLPGMFTLPVVDRDEARFAQATRQMIASEDFITIRFQDEPRHKKPIGIHWAQAAAVVALGPLASENAVWPYRVPSVIGATLAAWLLYFFLRSFIGEGAALLAGLLLASSVLLTVQAHLATTDALLLAAVVAAQGALMRRLLKPDRQALAYSLLFWGAQAIAVLIKGPVGPVVSVLTLVAWRLTGARFRPLTLLHAWIGLPVALLIALPWVIATSRATGGSFFADAITGDFFPKLISGQESHGFPPGYYLLLVTLTFWPGSLLAGFALTGSWKDKGNPLARLLLAWLVPTWIVLELIPTKLPHYVLPLYPALAALTAAEAVRWATRLGSERSSLPRARSLLIGWLVWSLVTAAFAGAVAAMPLALDGRFEPWSLIPAIGALAAIVAGCVVTRRLDAAPAVLGVLALVAVFTVTPALALVVPRIDALWPTRAVAGLIDSTMGSEAAADLPWAAVGDHEPSLVFALGAGTQLLGPGNAAEALAAGEVRGVIVERDQQEAFDRRARELHLSLQTLGTVRGVLISKGRRIELSVLVRDAPQPEP